MVQDAVRAGEQAVGPDGRAHGQNGAPARRSTAVFGRHSECRTRMKRIARSGLIVISLLACESGCMAALKPRSTLEGRPFDIEGAKAIHDGQTESEVRAILGDPLQATSDGPQTVWRYYERFTPRGCSPPILWQELRVKFQAGVVVSSEAVTPKQWP
jgi:outer membrane protein assembly factor BamE (lipoprotein component of BamABCDE complex)